MMHDSASKRRSINLLSQSFASKKLIEILFIDFIKQVEKWCAPLPWRKIASKLKYDAVDKKVCINTLTA